jgi:hypothetical protein
LNREGEMEIDIGGLDCRKSRFDACLEELVRQELTQ